MKNYFKTAKSLCCCIFLTSLFFSCQTEEITDNSLSNHFYDDVDVSKRESVNVADIPSLDLFLSEKIKGKRIKTKNAQNSIETPYGIVPLDNVLRITDSEGKINYTFNVIPENPKLDTFYNLIVYQSPEPDVKPVAYFLQYKMNEAFFNDFYSGRKTIDQFAGRIYKHSFDDFAYNKAFHAKLADPCNNEDGGGDGPINSCPIEDPDSDGSTGEPNDYIEIDFGDTSDSSSGGGGSNTSGNPDGNTGGDINCSLITITVLSCCNQGFCGQHPPDSNTNCSGAGGSATITTSNCVETNNVINNQDEFAKLINGGCDEGSGEVGINYLNFLTGSIFTGGMGSERMAWLNENCPERQLMFFIWNNSPMTSAELPLHRAMIDFMRASDNTADAAVVGEVQNAINQGGVSYPDAIGLFDFVKQFNYTDDVFDFSLELSKALYSENVVDKEIARGILNAINNNTVFDFSPYINPNMETINTGLTGICPNPPCNPSPDVETLWTFGGDLLQGLSDAFYSSLLRSYEWWVSDDREGKWIRNVLEHKGVDFDQDIDDETLGEMFIVRYDGSQLVIRWDSGLGADLIDLGFDVLDIATILSPSRGGGAYLAVNGGAPITKAALKAHLARLKQIAETTLAGGRGYKSFDAFKTAEGNASAGNNLHHIVEQGGYKGLNQQKFGKTNIHNTKNIIDIPSGSGSLHAKITGHYNSKPAFTNGKTVREWLADKSFDFQYNYGIQKLLEFGWDGFTGIFN